MNIAAIQYSFFVFLFLFSPTLRGLQFLQMNIHKIRTKFLANFYVPRKRKSIPISIFYPKEIKLMHFAASCKSWELFLLHPMAYFCVQLRAVASYLALSVLYMWAISGTSGSSGLGSVNREHMDSSTCITESLYQRLGKFVLY